MVTSHLFWAVDFALPKEADKGVIEQNILAGLYAAECDTFLLAG